MQSIFTNALSRMTSKHVELSRTRQETLCWLVLLMVRFGTVTLWRLAGHVETGVDERGRWRPYLVGRSA